MTTRRGAASRVDPGRTVAVLHVDDDPGFRALAADCLTRERDRFEVVGAGDANEALAVLAETEVDCVVSDYEMPGRDGLALLAEVRAEFDDLPFVLFTGKGSEEVASEAFTAGATEYLQKEGGTDQFTVLANRVEQCVAQARATARRAERTRRLEALHEFTADTDPDQDPETLAERAVEAAVDLLGFDLNGVYLYDEEADALRPAAASPLARSVLDSLPTFERGDGIAWEVYETGEHRLFADVREAGNVHDPDTPVRSELVVPLGDQGVFLLGSRTADDFTDDDERLAGILAADLRTALDRAAATERLRERERRLTGLQTRTADLAAATTTEAVVETAVDVASSELDLPLCGLHLVTNDGDRLEPAAVSERARDYFGRSRATTPTASGRSTG